MTDSLFEVDPICRKCGGTATEPRRVWSDKVGTNVTCPDKFHRPSARTEDGVITLHMTPVLQPIPAGFSPTMTLHEAREKLEEEIHEGASCPCCGQFARVYRWSLYSTAARALIDFYKLGGVTEFVHSNRLKERGHKGQGDAARLRHWGLVERQEGERDDGGKMGFWRVTPEGEAFVLRRSTIQKYAYVYDNRLLFLDGPRIGIKEALGEQFNYDELMNS